MSKSPNIPISSAAQKRSFRGLYAFLAVLLFLFLSFLVPLVWYLFRPHHPAVSNWRPEDFVGKWTGKWDDVWQVRFTITMDAQTKELHALYEWEENSGEPLKKSQGPAKFVDGVLHVNRVIEFTLSEQRSDRARAVGNFTKRRIADLIREPADN